MESWEISRAQLYGKAATWYGISLVSLVFVLISCGQPENTLPYYNSPSFTPLWRNESFFLEDTLHVIAPFSFTDQDGKKVTPETFKNKIYVANFFFTICPGICPKMTANLTIVAKAFQNNPEVLIISHSVTPDIDSIPQLKKYASRHGINQVQWHLVTGKQAEIYSLARQSYFAEQETGFTNSAQEFLHTEHFILVDRKGHIRGIYKGTLPLETERLITDIKILSVE